MFRKKNYFDKPQPGYQQREAISGCIRFDGEDLDYASRQKHFKNLQKQWLKQQMEEKKQRKAQEKEEELFYAQQTLELNRMRGMLSDDFQQRKTNMKCEMKDYNLNLNQQQRDMAQCDQSNKLAYEQAVIERTYQDGIKQQYPLQNTVLSMSKF